MHQKHISLVLLRYSKHQVRHADCRTKTVHAWCYFLLHTTRKKRSSQSVNINTACVQSQRFSKYQETCRTFISGTKTEKKYNHLKLINTGKCINKEVDDCCVLCLLLSDVVTYNSVGAECTRVSAEIHRVVSGSAKVLLGLFSLLIKKKKLLKKRLIEQAV